MSDRHLSLPHAFGGLLLSGLAVAAWATVPTAGVAVVAVGVALAGVAVATAARLPLPSGVRRWPWLVAVASVALTACHRGPVDGATAWWWAAETCALPVLAVPAVRRASGRSWALVHALGYGAAVALLPLRIAPHLTPPSPREEIAVLCLLWSLPAAGAAALGGYLRVQDATRRRALVDQRRRHRLEVARDLHDFAAHDVMGVVVLVQAARHLAREDPRRAVELLPRIEEAGLHALAAMDRTVSMLNAEEDPDREADPVDSVDSADTAVATGPGGGEDEAAGPVGAPARTSGRPSRPKDSPPVSERRRDLSELPALAARFTRTGTVRARLDVADGVLDGLPAEVGGTGYRVVMESLTNVRRHAPTALAVHIAARWVPYGDGRALCLTVTDVAGAPSVGGGEAGAGTGAAVPGSPLPERSGGGFGLAGLTDRVEALGGTLAAGPHGTAGWRVTAVLPLSGGATPTTGRPGSTAPARPTTREETRA
ncbi:histidine kinase [Streptomyces sp. NPDC048717]|uniref:sensor histidine kinase n=1 Tax=Streptomyces sp. NPDC048717 TaxID=3154928 RepID=UPI0034411E86